MPSALSHFTIKMSVKSGMVFYSKYECDMMTCLERTVLYIHVAIGGTW